MSIIRILRALVLISCFVLGWSIGWSREAKAQSAFEAYARAEQVGCQGVVIGFHWDLSPRAKGFQILGLNFKTLGDVHELVSLDSVQNWSFTCIEDGSANNQPVSLKWRITRIHNGREKRIGEGHENLPENFIYGDQYHFEGLPLTLIWLKGDKG